MREAELFLKLSKNNPNITLEEISIHENKLNSSYTSHNEQELWPFFNQKIIALSEQVHIFCNRIFVKLYYEIDNIHLNHRKTVKYIIYFEEKNLKIIIKNPTTAQDFFSWKNNTTQMRSMLKNN